MIKQITISLLAGATCMIAADFTPYQKASLLKENGRSLNSEDLEMDKLYYFEYPYKGTPAILMKTDLSDENNQSRTRLIAYLAINPNTYEFSNNDVSVLSYYKDDPFGDQVFRFCDDKSSFDARDGANVREDNSTNLPTMTAVRIEEDNRGKLYAVGLEDNTILKEYFKVEQEKLTKRFGSMWNAKIKITKTRAMLDEHFSLVTVRCNDKLPLTLKSHDHNKTYVDEIDESDVMDDENISSEE